MLTRKTPMRPKWTKPPRKPLVLPLVKPMVRAVMAVKLGDEVPVMVPKGIKARPGKRAPTVLERQWLDAVVAHGCMACRIDGTLVAGPDGVYEPQPPAVHHILRGGRRIGHLFTLPLCPGHHQKGTGAPGLIARHPDKARFEARYGKELDLLAKLKVELGFFTSAEYVA